MQCMLVPGVDTLASIAGNTDVLYDTIRKQMANGVLYQRYVECRSLMPSLYTLAWRSCNLSRGASRLPCQAL